MSFQMAVGKREIGRAVVVGSRQIAPAELLPAIHEEIVIDGVRVLVEKHINVGQTANLRRSEELDELGIEPVRQFTGSPTSEFIEMLRMRGPFAATDLSDGHLKAAVL